MYTKYTVWAFGPKRPPQFHDDGARCGIPCAIRSAADMCGLLWLCGADGHVCSGVWLAHEIQSRVNRKPKTRCAFGRALSRIMIAGWGRWMTNYPRNGWWRRINATVVGHRCVRATKMCWLRKGGAPHVAWLGLWGGGCIVLGGGIGIVPTRLIYA